MVNNSVITVDSDEQIVTSSCTGIHGSLSNAPMKKDDDNSILRGRLLRRQSMALNAVINQRRAFFGALISEIGSNMSLPSCMPQDHDLMPGHTLNNHWPIKRSSATNDNTDQSMQDYHQKHRPSLLLSTPINNTTVTLTTLDSSKALPSLPSPPKSEPSCHKQKHHAELMSTMSTLYAKLLVLVGVAIPVTASVSQQVPTALTQGFYLYLYTVSVAFVITLYTTLVRDRAVKKLLIKHGKDEKVYKFNEDGSRSSTMNVGLSSLHKTHQYGSFCLRLGAVGFGAGSLVFTGLQIGAEIASGPFRAITPAARLLLVTAQMHFIFLNSKNLELTRHSTLAKLGLMHMIATNLCEWLQALVQETRHEIAQLEHRSEGDGGILKTLLRDASPFLFPCTIEFSLICAVILFEMWKRVDEQIPVKNENSTRSLHHLSIDCSSAHRGLFGGILIIAGMVLSLIMFFVLKESNPRVAVKQVTALETAILISGVIASTGGAFKLRSLELKTSRPPHLDATLLAAAQAGVYLHCLFGAIGGILTMGSGWGLSLSADFLALVQSTVQTLLIKIAWRRRSITNDQKPGKELITFLIVVNIALWTVNTFEKSRAGVRPDHLQFFGVWAWTIITHVSMPLAIFFRFHSAICLFEVWKSCYKYRPLTHTPC